MAREQKLEQRQVAQAENMTRSWNGQKLQGYTHDLVSSLGLPVKGVLVVVIQLEKLREVWRNEDHPSCERMQKWHWRLERLQQTLFLLPLFVAQNESQYMTVYSHLVFRLHPETLRLVIAVG
jgi:hypothetical protein